MKNNPYTEFSYKGCTVRPESDANGIYFGVGLRGTNSHGEARHFVQVTFPDDTWIKCCNPEEARRYIDDNIHKHAR